MTAQNGSASLSRRSAVQQKKVQPVLWRKPGPEDEPRVIRTELGSRYSCQIARRCLSAISNAGSKALIVRAVGRHEENRSGQHQAEREGKGVAIRRLPSLPPTRADHACKAKSSSARLQESRPVRPSRHLSRVAVVFANRLPEAGTQCGRYTPTLPKEWPWTQETTRPSDSDGASRRRSRSSTRPITARPAAA